MWEESDPIVTESWTLFPFDWCWLSPVTEIWNTLVLEQDRLRIDMILLRGYHLVSHRKSGAARIRKLLGSGCD